MLDISADTMSVNEYLASTAKMGILIDDVARKVIRNSAKSNNYCNSFAAAVKKNIKINGYKNPLMAPFPLISEALQKVTFDAEHLQLILFCWLESRDELRKKIQEAIGGLGYECIDGKIDLDKKNSVPLIDEIASSILDNRDQDDEDEVRLASLLVLSGSQAAGGEWAKLSLTASDLLDSLKKLPPDDALWDDIDSLRGQLTSLAAAKLEERESIRKRSALQECVNRILANHTPSIEYCELNGIDEWMFGSCPPEVVGVILAGLEELEAVLDEFGRPAPVGFKTIKEEQSYHDYRKRLADDLKQRFVKLENIRNSEDGLSSEPTASKPELDPEVVDEAAYKPKFELEPTLTSEPYPEIESDSEVESNPGVGSEPEVESEPGNALEAEVGYEIEVSAVRGQSDALVEQMGRSGEPEGSDRQPATIGAVDVPAAIEDEIENVNSMIWKLADNANYSLAYHLSRYLEGKCGTYCSTLPSCIIHAVILSGCIMDADSDMVIAMGNDADQIFDFFLNLHDGKPQLSQALPIFASCLVPSLFVPASRMHDLLRDMHYPNEMNTLYTSLRKTVLEGLQQGVLLTPSLLKGVHEYKSWSDTIIGHQEWVDQWLTNNRLSHPFKGSGKAVWHKWLEGGSELGGALMIVAQGHEREQERVKAVVRDWSERGYIERQIVVTDNEVRGRKAALRPIEARLKQRLLKYAHEAVDLMSRWLEQLEKQPKASNGIEGSQDFQDWREKLIRELSEAQDWWMQAESAPGELTTARRILTDKLGFMLDLFDPQKPLPVDFPHLGQIVNGELLRIPGLKLNEYWEPLQFPADIGKCIQEALDSGALEDWEDAFQRHLYAGNHLATGQILEQLRLEQQFPLEELDGFSQERDENIEEQRRALKADILDTENKIEQAVQIDLITELERSEKLEITTGMRSDCDMILDFPRARKNLSRIRDDLERQKQESVEAVRVRLDGEDFGRIGTEQREKIEKMLERGDIPTAIESIDLLKSGQQLQDDIEQQRDIFGEFFPSFVEEFCKKAPKALRDVAKSIASQKTVGPLIMKGVRGAQLESAAEMVRAWDKVKARHSDMQKQLSLVMTHLGFKVESVEGENNPPRFANSSWFKVKAPLVLSPEELRIPPAFGSSAHGTYTLLCIWDRPPEEEIVSMAARKSTPSPIIIFYMGRLTVKGRRDMTRVGRKHPHKPLLVVDETLLCFLCGERGPRLKALFECALPFTVVNPYTDSGGMVPPEMFFGREREEHSIISLEGSCLVYGGRQLGKTALLRQVERKHHSVEAGLVVKWIDLKSQDIGYQRPSKDVWSVICSELHQLGIVSKPTLQRKTLEKKIEEWLNKDKSRRIILLLDEADAFLESDGSNGDEAGKNQSEGWYRSEYPNVLALKSLMDKTGRRFKFVLAGLHDVQASARNANTIFGHLGSPICIGPLLSNGEWRDALKLIREPLHVAGYRLEDETLPFRIFSHTNYYPSLIQLFCKYLINHFIEKTKGQAGRWLPHNIGLRDIEDAYLSQGLREGILYRFNLTLDLDNKYKVIALRIALEYASSGTFDPQSTRLNAEWVRKEAKEWWPGGFETASSLEDFQVMLDEMVGLGILRRHEKGDYSIRSHNLVNLLGSEAQIETALLEAVEQVPSKRFNPSSFRRGRKDGGWLRSPLTSTQESALTQPGYRSSVIFGSELAGLADIEDFLNEMDAQVMPVRKVTGKDRFLEQLEKLMTGIVRQEGMVLIVVNHELPWNGEWVAASLEVMKRRQSRDRSVCVVFIADPAKGWEWVGHPTANHMENVSFHTLKPWDEQAVSTWLLDEAIGPQQSQDRQHLMFKTGNWGGLLHAFGGQCKEGSHSWPEALDSVTKDVNLQSPRSPFGSVPSTVLACYRAMAEFEESVAVEDLDLLVDGQDSGEIESAIRWGDLFGFMCQEGRGKWRLNPLIARMVKE